MSWWKQLKNLLIMGILNIDINGLNVQMECASFICPFTFKNRYYPKCDRPKLAELRLYNEIDRKLIPTQ
jgi:hypothetical protein